MQRTHRFLVSSLAALCLAGFLTVTSIAQEGTSPDLAQTISRVRENVASLHKKLPDFICQEEVSVRTTENAKTIEERHYLLSLRAVRQPNDPENRFSESRDIISATKNGQPVNVQKNELRILSLRGGFARDLFTFFDEPTSSCYEFKPISAPETTDDNTMVLDVTLNKNPQPLPAECAHVPGALSSATVWIDLRAFEVVRLQERTTSSVGFSGPFARTNGTFTSSPVVEYAPVSIHGSVYWLPRSKRVDLIKTKGQYSISYTSQYSDYHKFETSAKITSVQQVN